MATQRISSAYPGRVHRHAVDLIERTPANIIYHRVTATASRDVLLAPAWCAEKWNVLNGIEMELRLRGTRQGSHVDTPFAAEKLRNVA